MLQQTQVDRVIPKYCAFLKVFPTFQALAHARLRDVLVCWQGLGYNRRAKMLHELAEVIVREHRGKLPSTDAELRTLPGIGPYTAGALRAFVYNEPAIFVETNIRSVYIHHFFKNRELVSDKEILSLVEQTLDRDNPREWYYALMDYGAMLKRTVGNTARQSARYVQQSKFEGSSRQLRGAIIRHLSKDVALSSAALSRRSNRDGADVRRQLARLVREGMIQRRRNMFTLA